MPDAATGMLTRRTLLATGAVTATAGSPARTSTGARRRRRVDVAVIGAGLAGLTAARALQRAGRSVLVLEARPRVGGRTLNHAIGAGEITELGGQFTGPTQDRLLALARELRVDTFKTYATGRNVFVAGGRRSTYEEGALAIPPDPRRIPLDPAIVELLLALLKLDRMAANVPVHAPWETRQAADWDSQTVETWKRTHILTPDARGIFDTICQAQGFEPRDSSLLALLALIASAGDERHAGSVLRLIGTTAGAQELRFAGGSQLLCLRIARELGQRVQLQTPVYHITQGTRGVRLQSHREDVEAKHVIVALLPALAGRIGYEPQLPPARDGLTQRVGSNALIKCEAVYERPFWREHGLTGMAIADRGTLRATFDNSPPTGKPGVLFGLIGGAPARAWASTPAPQRRTAVLADLATYFGDDALHPLAYFDCVWPAQRWSHGCGAIWPPGALSDHGPALRVPVDRIHWAGAETSPYWTGFMEGAVRSGERTAQETLEQL
jgi:monoamine oxidase